MPKHVNTQALVQRKLCRINSGCYCKADGFGRSDLAHVAVVVGAHVLVLHEHANRGPESHPFLSSCSTQTTELNIGARPQKWDTAANQEMPPISVVSHSTPVPT